MSEKDDRDADVESWFQSQDMDATADYLTRGRGFANLSLPDLTTQWAATFNDTDEFARNHDARRRFADYTSEFVLRGNDPPWETVKAASARIRKATQKMLRGMSKEAREDMMAAFEADLDEFRWQRDQKKQ